MCVLKLKHHLNHIHVSCVINNIRSNFHHYANILHDTFKCENVFFRYADFLFFRKIICFVICPEFNDQWSNNHLFCYFPDKATSMEDFAHNSPTSGRQIICFLIFLINHLVPCPLTISILVFSLSFLAPTRPPSPCLLLEPIIFDSMQCKSSRKY